MTSLSGRFKVWDTAWAAWKYGLVSAVDESSRLHTAAKALGIPSMPFSGNGENIWAYVAAITRKRLSERIGLMMCHKDILPLLILNQSKSEEPADFRGHACSGVHVLGDEKIKIARAVAVPQIGSLSFGSMGSLSLLFNRTVLRDQ